MIQIDEALAWLNQSPDDPRSHLTNRIRDLIIDIQSNDYPTGEMILLMDRAIIFSEGSLDAYEYPEVLLNCAVIVFKAELYAQARDYVVKAETEYATNLSDTYRRAVSSWVMGLVAWQLNENMIAYENYSATKSAFNEFLEKDLRFPNGGVYRYREDVYYGGGEWILLSAWLGWYYSLSDRNEKAIE